MNGTFHYTLQLAFGEALKASALRVLNCDLE